MNAQLLWALLLFSLRTGGIQKGALQTCDEVELAGLALGRLRKAPSEQGKYSGCRLTPLGRVIPIRGLSHTVSSGHSLSR